MPRIAGGVAVAGLLLSTAFRDFLVTQFYDQLHVNLDELERLVEIDSAGALKLKSSLSDPRYSAHLSGAYWEIQKGGKVLARSPSLEGPPLKIPAGAGENAQTHTYRIEGPTGGLMIAERLRWFGEDLVPTRIIIGTDQNALDREMQKFNYVLLWALGGFSLSLIAAAVLLLLYAMRPFAQLRRALAQVRTGDSSAIKGIFPEEVQPLIDDLNNLLASSGEQMVRARTQAGNIAHGLKSSLAILVDEGHRFKAKGDEDAAAVVLGEAKRMRRQIDYHIARARAAASRRNPQQATSLSDSADNVIAALERLHRDRQFTIQNLIPADVFVGCEAEDLEEILANIVDNACKFARKTIRLGVVKAGPRKLVGVAIEDDGPGLPAEAWDVVLDVGEQWGSSDGSGLGLAIVRDLTQLYGGSVHLDRSDLGGLKVILELPAHSTMNS